MTTENSKSIDSTPDDLLWHYTSFEVLTSIFSDPKKPVLRASHVDFLNDKSEYTFGIEKVLEFVNSHNTLIQNDLGHKKQAVIDWFEQFDSTHERYPNVKSFLDEVDDMEEKKINEIIQDLLSAKDKSDGYFDIPNIYSLSFSEANNSLYQWLAYCPKDGGIALGFNSEFISYIYTKFTEEEIERFRHFPPYTGEIIIKSKDDEDVLLNADSDITLNTVTSKVIYLDTDEKLSSQHFPSKDLDVFTSKSFATQNAVKIKHSAYHAEQEHRAVFHSKWVSKGIKPPPVKYTATKPYIEMPFEPQLLERIYISPRGDKEQTCKLVKHFIQHTPELQHITDDDIIISDIPFRD